MKLLRPISLALALATLLSLPVLAQNARISGTVKDSKGEPVIGASIFVKGTQTGTASDLEGAFSLQVPQGAVLEISAIG